MPEAHGKHFMERAAVKSVVAVVALCVGAGGGGGGAVAVVVWAQGSKTAAAAVNQETAPTIPAPPLKWADILKQESGWYASDRAVEIADNLLLYQRETGGWPKNTEMAAPLSAQERLSLDTQKGKKDSTIDNGATYTQIAYLARVHARRGLERHRTALLKGVDYLLAAQYDNGGWPQFYPNATGYSKQITFNDGAMIGVMRILRDIAAREPHYAFIDEKRRALAAQAVRKGIECILKTQIAVRGTRTVWCAQYDEVTLAPAPARKYELVSLSGSESVGIVRFLMDVENPDERTSEAIRSAVAWFKRSKLTGIAWVKKPDAAKPGGFDRVVIQDPHAEPLWARFYEIETNRPIFVGRDGIAKYSVAEIEHERRNGYQWYVTSPTKLISEEYPAWLEKMARAKNADKI